jgi:hypothetical protein
MREINSLIVDLAITAESGVRRFPGPDREPGDRAIASPAIVHRASG